MGEVGGPGVENLVFDFAAATGQLRTSYLVGVEYRLLWGVICVLGGFGVSGVVFEAFCGRIEVEMRVFSGADRGPVRPPIFRKGRRWP